MTDHNTATLRSWWPSAKRYANWPVDQHVDMIFCMVGHFRSSRVRDARYARILTTHCTGVLQRIVFWCVWV
jgi:hypothetical protein